MNTTLYSSRLYPFARKPFINVSAFDLKNWAGWSSLEPALRYVHDNPKMLKKAVVNAGL